MKEEIFKKVKGMIYDINIEEINSHLTRESVIELDDLISRQAAIEACLNGWNYDMETIKHIQDNISRLPSVQQKQNLAYWIGKELGECSNCGHNGCASDIWNGCLQMFCPNCGAKMEGGRNMSEKREILFRGKRVDNGEWVEGLPIRTYDTEIGKNSVDYANPVPVVLMASGRIVLECGYDEVPFFNIDEYPIVDPETISQYTGLTDKNGTRIFEGDIISAYLDDISPEGETRLLVCWNDYGWHGKTKYGYETLESDWVNHYFEVIGNVHDGGAYD